MRLLVDQLLSRLRGKKRQEHVGLGAAPGKLLAHHLPGFQLDFGGGDAFATDLGDDAGARSTDTEI